jgi:hypothetical protein
LQKLTNFQATLPTQAIEDDAIKALVSSYLKQNDFLNMERKQNEQLERRRRLSLDSGILSQDQLAKIPRDPATGAYDIEALHDATVAEKARREVLEEQAKAQTKIDTKAAAEAKTAETKKAQAEEKMASEGVKDADAFPSRVAEYLAKTKFTPEEAEAAPEPEYLVAKRFDENRLAQESMAALNYDEDEYVNYLDDARKKANKTPLTKAQKDARRAVWRRAKRLSEFMNTESAEGETEPTDAPAAPATAPAAPATAPPAAPAPAASAPTATTALSAAQKLIDQAAEAKKSR